MQPSDWFQLTHLQFHWFPRPFRFITSVFADINSFFKNLSGVINKRSENVQSN